jgi:hypothetical protein
VLRGTIVLTLVVLVTTTASAQTRTDVVVLANGDRITGEVSRLERGRLEFKTDDAGTIYFEWDKIVRLEATREFEVLTSDFRRLIGRLSTTGQGTLVITAADGTTSVPISEITNILPLGAGFWARIDGTFDSGFTYTRSSAIAQFTLNSNTSYHRPSFVFQLTASATLTHETDTDERDDRGAVGFSYVRYRRGNLFFSGAARFETNESLGLLLRSEVGGQVGQRFVNTNRAQLETGAGLVVTDEQAVDSESRQNIEGQLSFKYSFYAYNRPQTNVDVSMRYYPSLSQWGRQRIQFDTSLRRELWKDFFVSLNVFDTFDSEPPDLDAARNDVGVVTSFGWSY